MKKMGSSALSAKTPIKRKRKKLTPLQKARKKKLRNFLEKSEAIDIGVSSSEGIWTPSVKIYSEENGRFKTVITFWDVTPHKRKSYDDVTATSPQPENINKLKDYLRKRGIEFDTKRTKRPEYINWQTGIKGPRTHNISIRFRVSGKQIDNLKVKK